MRTKHPRPSLPFGRHGEDAGTLSVIKNLKMKKINEKQTVLDLLNHDDFELIKNSYNLKCTFDELKSNPEQLFGKVSFSSFIINFLSERSGTIAKIKFCKGN